MPQGKPAGVRCVQLGPHHECLLFGKPERPSFCVGLQPSTEMCGQDRTDALGWLALLELKTQPFVAVSK
jgi:hypothetical protein